MQIHFLSDDLLPSRRWTLKFLMTARDGVVVRALESPIIVDRVQIPASMPYGG